MSSTASRSLPEYDHLSIYPHAKRLSSSQVIRYIESPSDFYIEYTMGVKGKGSKAMQLGRIFAACYADRSLDARGILEEAGLGGIVDLFISALSKFPVLTGGHPEFPMICEFMGWEFRATLDDFVEKSSLIVENKTGQVPWTQQRANDSVQVTFQAWCHWKKHGTVPKKILLNWWNTKAKHVDVRSFKTSRTLQQLTQFEETIRLVVINIEAGNFTQNIYG